MCLFLFSLNYFTPSQDSACIKMCWSNKNVPFLPFICETKHKTKQDHYVDHDACISHISLLLPSKCLGKQNKIAICFHMQKGIVILKDKRGGIFRILCEKGQNLEVKKQKKTLWFLCRTHSCNSYIIIMIIFGVFSDTIMWLVFQAMLYHWFPAW